jgi:alpha-beta hydrolase superfamily lysophospholipase
MAENDLPALFDKVSEITGQEKLYYIGHSQGVSILLARLVEDPDFHKRIHAVFALAPAVTVINVRGTLNMLMNTPWVMRSLTVPGHFMILYCCLGVLSNRWRNANAFLWEERHDVDSTGLFRSSGSL